MAKHFFYESENWGGRVFYIVNTERLNIQFHRNDLGKRNGTSWRIGDLSSKPFCLSYIHYFGDCDSWVMCYLVLTSPLLQKIFGRREIKIIDR